MGEFLHRKQRQYTEKSGSTAHVSLWDRRWVRRGTVAAAAAGIVGFMPATHPGNTGAVFDALFGNVPTCIDDSASGFNDRTIIAIPGSAFLPLDELRLK